MEFQRESVFVSALRTFCRMFFGVCALFLAFMVMSFLYNTVSSGTNSIETKTKIKYLSDAENRRELVAATAPVILQINVHGVIGDSKAIDTERVKNVLIESRTGTLKDNRVKGILLHMNTPGGTVVDSDNIYRMIKDYKERYKVPVYAYIDGLCASGGMYVSCSADKVYAGPASIIGSVGVIIGPFFNLVEGLKSIGIKSQTITEGLDKDMMSPFRPWKENEDASLRAVTAYFYEQFVNIVTQSHPRMDKTRLVQEYGAKVFDPVQAEALGYIDQANASRDQTLLDLLAAANIDATKPYQVVSLEPKSEWINNLFNEKSPLFTGKIEHTVDLGAPPIRDQIAYLYQPNG